jgi:hypothetical protein
MRFVFEDAMISNHQRRTIDGLGLWFRSEFSILSFGTSSGVGAELVWLYQWSSNMFSGLPEGFLKLFGQLADGVAAARGCYTNC